MAPLALQTLAPNECCAAQIVNTKASFTSTAESFGLLIEMYAIQSDSDPCQLMDLLSADRGPPMPSEYTRTNQPTNKQASKQTNKQTNTQLVVECNETKSAKVRCKNQ